jgi:hypothetical protein
MQRIEKVLILSPLLQTGGPEALHQLAGSLRRQGLNGQIMYYGGADDALTVIKDGVLKSTHSQPSHIPEQYRRYAPMVTDQCVLDASVCLVAPEIMPAELLQHTAPASTAIWWLSVDNGLLPGSPLRDVNYLRAWLKKPILNFAQSAYAAGWLAHHGRPDRWMLGDYTDPDFTQTPASLGTRERQILFNPRKGGDAVQLLQPLMPGWAFLPLEKMSKHEVRARMQQSRYYIDFGHHPGKDRLPREAAASGCVVLTLRAGAAQYFDDVPLADTYKFARADIHNGNLAQTMAKLDLDFDAHWHAQSRYRSWIKQEQHVFDAQVAAIFGG